MTAILTNPRERTRFLRFAVVGIIGAVVDFGVMNLLSSLFPVPIVIGNVVISPLVWAGTISFIAAILSNFTWNRYWTYPDLLEADLAPANALLVHQRDGVGDPHPHSQVPGACGLASG